MYYISIFFDEKTEKRMKQFIKQVSKKTGNRYMLDEKIPAHLTVLAFETHREEDIKVLLNEIISKEKKGRLQWVSIGVFVPYVIYITPVLNEYLHNLSLRLYNGIEKIDDIKFSPYNRPFQWLPHTTIAKKLTEEEMLIGFQTLKNMFGSFSGEVVKINLAKVKPYREIMTWNL